MTRFELATPRPPDVYATGLRHIPNYYNLFPGLAGGKCKRILQKSAILHKIFLSLNEGFIKADNHF